MKSILFSLLLICSSAFAHAEEAKLTINLNRCMIGSEILKASSTYRCFTKLNDSNGKSSIVSKSQKISLKPYGSAYAGCMANVSFIGDIGGYGFHIDTHCEDERPGVISNSISASVLADFIMDNFLLNNYKVKLTAK